MSMLSTGTALLDSGAILKYAGLAPGMHYADFGCGALGHFVFPASDLAGRQGKVYAVDVLKSALAGIESRTRHEQATNVERVWADIERAGGVRIPEHSLDLVSVVNICRVINKSPVVLDEITRVLKPDGRVLLVDWKKSGGPLGPPAEQRVSMDDLTETIGKKGFAVEESFEAGTWHWGLILRRA